MKEPRPPVTVIVTGCWECPHSYDENPDGDEPWTCTAAEDRHGYYRKLGKRQDADGEWVPPPRWCPLRKADRLVTLRLP